MKNKALQQIDNTLEFLNRANVGFQRESYYSGQHIDNYLTVRDKRQYVKQNPTTKCNVCLVGALRLSNDIIYETWEFFHKFHDIDMITYNDTVCECKQDQIDALERLKQYILRL